MTPPLGRAIVVCGDAAHLPLPDESVDLIVTSPPYFALRAYTDGGEVYDGQIGSEATPREFLRALWTCTREWMRVLKPEGSIFVNLGDKYSTYEGGRTVPQNNPIGLKQGDVSQEGKRYTRSAPDAYGIPYKSLMGLPWRYALGCIDDLGLILRAEIVWHKANGLPESVTDRVRRSHEQWFHLVKQPRYYSAVDEIREPHAEHTLRYYGPGTNARQRPANAASNRVNPTQHRLTTVGALGKLPGSVWSIPSEPLTVPPELGVDHFACVDTETEVLTRRGWLRHDQVQVGDEVAGYDFDTGLTSWTRCHGVHRYDYDGSLVAVDGRGLSMRLTPNHRTLVHRRVGRAKARGPIEVINAADLRSTHLIPRALDWSDDGREKPISADMAALLGWIAAEGWYGQGRSVYLSQSATKNPLHVEAIDALLSRLGGGYAKGGVYPTSGGRWRVRVQRKGVRYELGTYADRAEAEAVAESSRGDRDSTHRTETQREWRGKPWTDVTWRLSSSLAAEVRRIMPDKLLPIWIADIPTREARALLDAFVDGDGHRRADGRLSIFQRERHNLDVLQAVAVRLGYNTTLKPDDGNGRWVLYLNPARPALLRRSDGTSLVGHERYTGIVWCVTTGTGTFVARRNGTVFVTGNSFPSAWPMRLIAGWSPPGICMECGEGRRPVVDARRPGTGTLWPTRGRGIVDAQRWHEERTDRTLVGYACACTPYTDHPGTGKSERGGERWGAGATPDRPRQNQTGSLGQSPRVGPWREYHFDAWTPPPTRPAVVLDPFGGTGTTALAARALGRIGVTVDLSHDYCRLARWRTTDPGQLARVLGRPKPPKPVDGQSALFDLTA